MLIKYTGTNVVGNKVDTKRLDIFIDAEFKPSMDIINDAAKELGLQVVVISAKRDTINVKGAIVKPATNSNHLVGHAVDVNFIVTATGQFFNSKMIQASTAADSIGKFIKAVKQKGIRWGGEFLKKDPVHFDDGLNVKNPERYKEKIKEYFK